MLWLELCCTILGVLIHCAAHLLVHHHSNIPVIVLHHHSYLLIHITLVLFLLLVLIVLLQAHLDVIVQLFAFLIRQLIKIELQLLIIIIILTICCVFLWLYNRNDTTQLLILQFVYFFYQKIPIFQILRGCVLQIVQFTCSSWRCSSLWLRRLCNDILIIICLIILTLINFGIKTHLILSELFVDLILYIIGLIINAMIFHWLILFHFFFLLLV